MTKHYFLGRLTKDWDNKRIDWILSLRKDKYQWISRWYTKKSAIIGDLTIQEILNINLSSYPLDNQQKSHYDNHLSSMSVAQQLFSTGLNRDACLHSHLAAEHLAKQLYLKTSLSYKLKYSRELSTKHREPHRSHEVGAIITEITRISSAMRGLSELVNVKIAVDNFKSNIGEWSSARYDSPILNSNQFQVVGQNLITELNALVIALNKIGSVK